MGQNRLSIPTPAITAGEALVVPPLEQQATYGSAIQQPSQTSNSLINNPSSKETPPPTKKIPNPIIGTSFGIESVIENIRMSKGTKLIHNGLVRKEAPVNPMFQTTDTLRITKTEFAKLLAKKSSNEREP